LYSNFDPPVIAFAAGMGYNEVTEQRDLHIANNRFSAQYTSERFINTPFQIRKAAVGIPAAAFLFCVDTSIIVNFLKST